MNPQGSDTRLLKSVEMM